MKKRLLSLLLCLSIAGWVAAQVPGTMAYQGILVDNTGAPVADGAHFVQFTFYDALTAGNVKYQSTGTGSGNSVTTFKGMFTFTIGSGTAGNSAIPASIWGQQLYVEVMADNVTLTPRIQLTTTPYSFQAQAANTVDASGITGTLPLTNGGTGATTAAGAIANLGLGTLATLSSVTSAQITDGTIAAADLGTGSVTTTQILDGTIAAADLGTSSVTTTQILDGTIATADIAANAITAAKLANTAVTAGTYGTATQVPQFTVDAQGRVTAASNLAIGVGTVTNVTATAPLSVLSGSTIPSISISKATTSVDGYLASADWNTFNGKPSGAGTANQLAFWSSASALSAPVAATGLTWDNTNFRLGINNTSPTQKLDVVGTIKATTFSGAHSGDGSALTNLSAGNIATGTISNAVLPANVPTGSGTASQIAYWSAANTMGSTSGLFWDAVNGRLGINQSTPVGKFDLKGAAVIGTAYSGTIGAPANGLIVQGNTGIGTSTVVNQLDVAGGMAIGAGYAGVNTATTNGLLVQGNVGIGNPVPAYQIDIGDGVFTLAKMGATWPIYLMHNKPTVGFNIYNTAGTKYGTANSGGTISFSNEVADGFSFNTAPLGVADAGATMTSRMVVTNTGSVGIGTTAPASKLDVEGGVAIGASYSGATAAPSNGAIIQGNVGIGTNSPTHNLEVSGTSKIGNIFDDGSTYTSLGGRTSAIGSSRFDIATNSGSGNYGGMYIDTQTGGLPFYGYSLNGSATAYHYLDGSDANKWKLFNGGVRLTVTSTGFVGIGTTAPDNTLSVIGGADKTGGGSWTNFSDRRVKKDINAFVDGLAVLKQIRPVRFKYNGLGPYPADGIEYIGVIAQEVQPVAPYMINSYKTKLRPSDSEETDLLRYDGSALTYILVNSVKEQQTQIEELRSEVTRLKAQLSELDVLAAQVQELRKAVYESSNPRKDKTTLTASNADKK